MSAPHSHGPDCEECEGPCLVVEHDDHTLLRALPKLLANQVTQQHTAALLAELHECQAALSALLGGDPDLIARTCGSTTLGNRLIHVRRAIVDATKDKPQRLGLEEAQELGCFTAEVEAEPRA